MRRLLSSFLAAAAILAAAPTAADAVPARLGSYVGPADAAVRISPGKSWSVPLWRCEASSQIDVFGAGGRDVGFNVDPDFKPFVYRAIGRDGVVVYSERSNRIYNFTPRPVIAGMWCATISR